MRASLATASLVGAGFGGPLGLVISRNVLLASQARKIAGTGADHASLSDHPSQPVAMP
jgi:hypothetical protein